MTLLMFLIPFVFIHASYAKGSETKIECTPEIMKVSVPMDGNRKTTYLDQLKYYKPCLPSFEGNVAIYILDLQDHYKCGVTKVLNNLTGKKTFYHKIVIEDKNDGRELVRVRCEISAKQRVTRATDTFPLDFNEPDVLNITRYEEGRAPEPVLGAVVKQNGKQVSGEISVSPGTPLSMEIFLDNSSAPIYGLSVSYMHVTDTGKQQETIIFNGCSVDPYLFDNFVTTDGDKLMAKFRAFKFPDTTYVQFRGTVSVCLDSCLGVQCSNGVTGYGRRKRSIPTSDNKNRVYEVSLTTFIKVDWNDSDREQEDVLALLKNLKVANQMLGDKEGTSATVAEKTRGSKLVIRETVNSAVINKLGPLIIVSILYILSNLH